MELLKKIAKKIFQYEARIVLKKYKPRVIAITGSVGKTVTKEALYLMLSKRFFVRKSEKSFTTELGIPLAIIGCPVGSGSVLQWAQNIFFGLRLIFTRNAYPDWLILEMDGDKPGDLQGVSRWICPDILILTAIGETPSHIELFQNMSHFLDEKRYLVDAVRRDGFVVFNADDSHSSNLATGALVKKVSCCIGVDLSAQESFNVIGSEFKILYSAEKTDRVPTGMSFEIFSKGEKSTVSIFQSLGMGNEYACLLSYAVARELGISHFDIVSSLNMWRPVPGRMNIIPGLKGVTIIDDSYNSSPVSFYQAADVFSHIKFQKRKIVVLGDMLELGRHSVEEHKKIARMVKNFADIIFCVGIRAYVTSNELLSLGFDKMKIFCFDNSLQAGEELQKILKEGDIILVKGSQAMRMERVVEEVMRHPEDREKLLVRQEREWLSRD